MKLEKIEIKNFKGIVDESVSPTNFACLVGENNAGKSTVLQAIVFALNRPSQLPAELFYDPDQAIEFDMQFTGIGDGDMARLAEDVRTKYDDIIVGGELRLTVRYRVGVKVEMTTSRKVPTEPRYQDGSLAEAFKGKTGAAVREVLSETYGEFDASGLNSPNATAAKAFLRDCIADLPSDQFTSADSPLPSGIPASISNLLPEPIYIPAVKNLSDDLKTTQTTSFGRLLALLLEDMEPDLAAINQSLNQLQALLNRTDEGGQPVDQRHDKVRALETSVEDLLRENFPAVKVELSIPRPELKTILSAAQIYVDDGSRDLIDNKGDGIKRSLTFALLQAYVAKLRGRAAGTQTVQPRPLIFLFEEPELYLHPKSQRVLFRTLSKISESFQVLVTTHSPLFFAPGITAAFVRVAKESGNPKPRGRLYPVNFALDAQSAEVFRLARFENADAAFFSRRVVFFEGESDDAYCRHVAGLANSQWDFDGTNTAMVRVSGKGNFAKFRAFFEAFGIEVKIVADLDVLFDGYQHLGAPPICTTMKATALQTVDRRLAALGTPCEPSPRQIRDRVHQASWQQRYEEAKATLRKAQAGEALDTEKLSDFDRLFTWENDVGRQRVCKEDREAALSLVPLLDALRSHGICVLSKGAIEDYYPAAVSASGAKPSRALSACASVTTAEEVRALSAPLGDGREPELYEIFAEIFRA